jgi:hypothetical protein
MELGLFTEIAITEQEEIHAFYHVRVFNTTVNTSSATNVKTITATYYTNSPVFILFPFDCNEYWCGIKYCKYLEGVRTKIVSTALVICLWMCSKCYFEMDKIRIFFMRRVWRKTTNKHGSAAVVTETLSSSDSATRLEQGKNGRGEISNCEMDSFSCALKQNCYVCRLRMDGQKV